MFNTKWRKESLHDFSPVGVNSYF